MRVRKSTSNILFRLVLLLFSALLAVLTLLTGIDLTAESERIGAEKKALLALEEEQARLQLEIAGAWELDELEDYARRTLGMRQREPEQVIVIHSEG